MVDRTVAHNAQLRASRNADGGRSAGLSGVVATEVGAGHVGDRSLRVEVVRLANIRPRRSGRPANDERRESV